MEPQFAGSSWHRGQMTDGPAGANRVDYAIVFPKDDLMLGATDFVLNNPGNPSGTTVTDTSAQSEQTSYIIFKEIGVHYNNRRYVHMFVNGMQRSTNGGVVGNFIFEDSQQPNSDVVEEWFADDTNGDLYKIEDWFEWNNTATAHEINDADLQRRLIPGTTNLHFGAYRFMWRRRSIAPSESASDYTSLVELLDAVTPFTDSSSIANVREIETLANIEQWMRIFAVQHTIGNWDSYGYRRGKNAYTYKGRDGRFEMMTWDIDFTMGIGGDGSGQGLFESTDPRIIAIWQNQAFLRAYWRAFRDIVNGPLNNSFLDPILDAKAAALRANNITFDANAVQTIKTYITQRRANIAGQIPSASFNVNTPSSITTNNNLLTITGTAPIEVKTIKINGLEYNVVWSAVTGWSIRLPLTQATNELIITAYDVRGNQLTNFIRTINAVYTGSFARPEDHVVINEIMYNPVAPDGSYVEILNTSTNVSFDLSGWRFNGLGYEFPPGSFITNGQVLLLVKNRTAAFNGYAISTGIFDEFPGNIDPDGETLSLIRPGATPEEDTIIDRVRYEAAAPWARGANGGTASLQLIDARQDNARVSNWSDSSGWKLYTYSNNLTAGSNRFLMYLGAAAEIYIDDLTLVAGGTPEVGENLISNGDFEGPLLTSDGGPWSFFNLPGMSNTTISTTTKYAGNGALKFVQTIGGTAAYMYQDNLIVPTSGPHTLSFRYIPITNNTTFNHRVNAFFRDGPNVRANLISPGSTNPTAAILPPYPRVWLNEVQGHNVDGIRDASGTAEPWIELYNAGSNTLSLAGLFLADNYDSNLTQWAFPNDATIGPGEFKIIWADGDSDENTLTEWHTSFRLPANSGALALTRLLGNSPQILDYLTYSNVGPNLSYGDYPDGQPFTRTIFYTVTPGATNQARPGQIFINEWLAGNQTGLADPADGDREDWFELFNPNDFDVNLGGYYLSDTLTNKTQYRIPNRYTIPAHGFLLVWADNESGQNSNERADLHASFALSRTGEALALFGPDGTLVDGITFGEQTNDVSEGRFPDGAPHRYFMTTLTPRTNNIVPGLNNTPPVLAAIGDVAIDEGQRLSFRATATDFDQPSQQLSFSLGAGAPSGAQITGQGEFRWIPSEAQGPNLYPITVRVTDNGVPAESDARTFNVTVREVNRRPFFSNTQGKYVKAGETLSFLTGFDSDLPANALAFSLEPGAPAGMSLDAVTGRLSWTPGDADAGFYAVAVQATDNGVPPLSAAQTYRVYVYESTNTLIAVDLTREGGNVRLSWPAEDGAQYEVQFKNGLAASWQIHPLPITILGGISSTTDPLVTGPRFYRVLRTSP